MLSRISMNAQRALSGRVSDARTSQAVNLSYGRAKSPKSLAASARAVRPLAASARPQWFDTAMPRSTEPALSSVERVRLPGHSFLGRTKNPNPIKFPVSLREVTACSERMQALRWSAEPKTRDGAVQAALPNPSIEGDAQRLSPLVAPHVKR